MKKLLGILCAMLLIAGTAGMAGATPCTWTDTVEDNASIAWGGSYSYTHDITDDGFVPLVDLATDYVLTIGLYDDNRGWDEMLGVEVAFVDQPGLLGDGSYSFAYENQDFGASILGLVQINLLGTLDVTIQSLWGDFCFGQSVLTAYGESNSAPVPEPASMVLLGTGLLGLAGYGRKKFKR